MGGGGDKLSLGGIGGGSKYPILGLGGKISLSGIGGNLILVCSSKLSPGGIGGGRGN